MADGNRGILLRTLGFISHSRTCRHLRNNCIYVHNTLFVKSKGHTKAQMLCGAQALTEARVLDTLWAWWPWLLSPALWPEHLRTPGMGQAAASQLWPVVALWLVNGGQC